MNELSLSKKQAFLAMFTFLEEYYEMTHADDIGSLLGSLALLEDGCSADTGVQEEWDSAVNRVLDGNIGAKFVLKHI